MAYKTIAPPPILHEYQEQPDRLLAVLMRTVRQHYPDAPGSSIEEAARCWSDGLRDARPDRRGAAFISSGAAAILSAWSGGVAVAAE